MYRTGEKVMRKHVNHMFLLKTTHARLVANNIEFEDQIPKSRHALKKLGFTDRQIIDLWEHRIEYCVVLEREEVYVRDADQKTNIVGPFRNGEEALEWGHKKVRPASTDWRVCVMMPSYLY